MRESSRTYQGVGKVKRIHVQREKVTLRAAFRSAAENQGEFSTRSGGVHTGIV